MTMQKLDVFRSFSNADSMAAEMIEIHYGLEGLRIYNDWIALNDGKEKSLLTFLEQTSIQHVMIAARNKLLLGKQKKKRVYK
jgi:predicted N-formylglutamate amidohydrolase